MASIVGIAGQRQALGGATQATVRLSGIVVTTDETPMPVRRAIVSLSGGRALGYHTITDDDGRFTFEAVPAGRYELSAARKPFLTIGFGATRPGRPGTPLVLEQGRDLENLRVVLARGAIITGMVHESTGEPVVNLEVRVERLVGSPASRSIVTTVATDDQGVYRAFGLAAGTYVVSSRPPTGIGSGDLSAPSEAKVDAMLRELQQGRGRPAPRGDAAVMTPNTPANARSQTSSGSLDVVPVYHPGAFMPDDAALVTIRAGEERAGVDITVGLMATSTVGGRIQTPDGRPLPNIYLSLSSGSPSGTGVTRTTNVRSDGTFTFAGVAPGRYVLAARAMSEDTMRASLGFPPLGNAPVTSGACAFAVEDASVTGTDLTGLSLTLRPCLKIAGRIEFDAGPDIKAPSNNGVNVVLESDVSARGQAFRPLRTPAVAGRDDRFLLGEFGDVLPGAYHLRIELPGTEPGRGWWLQSGTADGRDILDAPLVLSGDSPATTTVVFTFTDRHTSLAGVLETASGRPAVDYTVIAFTTNREWWRAPFRRVRMARPATNGEYLFHDLPPGEYYLAALTDLAPDDWRNPEFLSEAVGVAVGVTIGPGEQMVQNLRIRYLPSTTSLPFIF